MATEWPFKLGLFWVPVAWFHMKQNAETLLPRSFSKTNKIISYVDEIFSAVSRSHVYTTAAGIALRVMALN